MTLVSPFPLFKVECLHIWYWVTVILNRLLLLLLLLLLLQCFLIQPLTLM